MFYIYLSGKRNKGVFLNELTQSTQVSRRDITRQMTNYIHMHKFGIFTVGVKCLI